MNVRKLRLADAPLLIMVSLSTVHIKTTVWVANDGIWQIIYQLRESYLFGNYFKLTSKEISKLCITSPVSWESTGDLWSHNTSYIKIVCIAWQYPIYQQKNARTYMLFNYQIMAQLGLSKARICRFIITLSYSVSKTKHMTYHQENNQRLSFGTSKY